MLGRPLFVDGLRARPSQSPPLRLARVRCERESVVVVCPPVLLTVKRGEGGCGEVDRMDVHRDFCEVAVLDHVSGRRTRGRVPTTLAALQLDAVWVPDERIRVMRRRPARRRQLVGACTRAKNEIHAVLVRRLKGRPPASDLFGVKGRSWLARVTTAAGGARVRRRRSAAQPASGPPTRQSHRPDANSPSKPNWPTRHRRRLGRQRTGESGRERDTGARITRALKGPRRAADHKPLTPALRLVGHPRPHQLCHDGGPTATTT